MPDTSYHSWTMPTVDGSTDTWGQILNDMFDNEIDADVERRGTLANRPSAVDVPNGAKYLVTSGSEVGTVYVESSDSWVELGRVVDDDASLDGLSLKPQNGTTDLVRTEPPVDMLREGYIVGIRPGGYQTVVDPRDHTSAAVALQQANDNLIAGMSGDAESGKVFFPPVDPDGNRHTIDQTVSFGDPDNYLDVLPHGWGFWGNQRRSPFLQVTIDDGSAMFRIESNQNNDDTYGPTPQATEWGFFGAEAFGNDAMCLYLKNVNAFHLKNIGAYEFAPSSTDGNTQAEGVYNLDGNCFNAYINKVNYTAPSANDHTQTDVWRMLDTDNNGQPGEVRWGPANSTYCDPSYPANNYLTNVAGSDNLRFVGGRTEGFGGTAHFYAPNGGEFQFTGWEFGRTEDNDGTGTSMVQMDGGTFVAEPSCTFGSNDTNSDCHGYYFPNGLFKGDIHVPSDPLVTGDLVNIGNDNGSSNIVRVPRENSFEGTATYPAEFRQLRYHDGWQRATTGSATGIAPGGVTEVEGFVAGDGESMDWEIRLQDGWTGDVSNGFLGVQTKNTANDDQAGLGIWNRGPDSIDVDYEVFYKEND